MRQKRNQIGTLFFLALLFLSFQVSAQSGRKAGRAGGQMDNKTCMQIPGLSPEQENEMETKRLAYFSERKSLRNDLQMKHKALVVLLKTDEPDQEKVEQKITEISGVKEALTRSFVDHVQEMRKILTNDEQKKYFDSHCVRNCQKRCAGKKGRRF